MPVRQPGLPGDLRVVRQRARADGDPDARRHASTRWSRPPRTGNVSALRSLEDAGLHLGWAIGSLVNLFNPSLVVVGGDLARAGDLLLDSARVGLRRHALDAVAATPVVASELGHRASLVGAGAARRRAHRAALGLDSAALTGSHPREQTGVMSARRRPAAGFRRQQCRKQYG